MSSALLVATLLSGFSALMCEVVWARPLRLMVGDTSLAVSLVLSIFFLGMAIGAWLIGGRSDRLRDPLRACAVIEMIIGAFALLSMPLLGAAGDLHFAALRAMGGWLNVPSGVILSAAVLLIPTALMGAALPLLIQAAARGSESQQTGRASLLYAVNTFGGALGALLSAPVLVPLLGLWQTCAIAGVANGIAATLLWCAECPSSEAPPPDHIQDHASAISIPLLATLALGSGAVAMGCEVLWVRSLSSALSNSSLSFALLLACVLVGIAIGGWIAGRLDVATRWAPLAVTLCLLSLALLVACALTPQLVMISASLRLWFMPQGFVGGLVTELGVTATLVFLPSILSGMVLPLLFAAWPGGGRKAGRRWGLPLAFNTAGAVLGSTGTALILIPVLHIRGTGVALALVSAALGLSVWKTGSPRSVVPRTMTAALILALGIATLLMPSNPLLRDGHRLLSRTEGLGANVSVTETADGVRTLIVNDRYVIGGSEGRMLEFRQALIPALLHPNPRRIFHLGMGTGHTAGALARVPGVEHVVTCDNLPGVIDAAQRWFGDTNLGLFESGTAEIATADGRHWILSHSEKFDLIVIDNLLPWLDGTSHIFSREHFEALRASLRPGGILCVWLPLHQVDVRQTALIDATLRQVFPSVHLWIARPETETSIGLIATGEPLSLGHLLRDSRLSAPSLREPLEIALIDSGADIFAGLCGVNAVPTLDSGSLASDNWPILEHWAAETFLEDLVLHPDLIASPSQVTLWTMLAEIRERGEDQIAQSLGVNAATDVDPLAVMVWNRWQNISDLTQAMADLGRRDAHPERHWLRAVERDPSDPLPLRAIDAGLIGLVRAEQWREAANLGNEVPNERTLSISARRAWAVGLLNSGQHYRARRALERILEDAPNDVDSAVQLIRAHHVMNRDGEAMRVLREYHAIAPNHPAIARLWSGVAPSSPETSAPSDVPDQP